ncbi:helix-turn-helix domain-containing protein [Ruegeria meonggei]|uniref:Anaerobic benzoate catabolism transcriptional regulator n=1 Tax=Ruegeria meonggei TaxID=1446476 RepID=A0A1X6YYF8_9RHOB|nr:XRE family transcriptional regulator [Ruegeria meonggei]SLN35477.1 anaerobic benzoate catabolism transcriptional regulator [Ruegeria meonggei]
MINDLPETDAQRLGSEIREVRKARGLTLKGLSDEVSCSTAYLSRMELGSAKVSAELLREISAALSVEPDWFFPIQAGTGPLERRHVVRAGNRRNLSGMYTRTATELGFEDELLSSTLSGDCYLILSRFPPGAGSLPELTEGYTFEGEQHAIVVTGEVELRLGDEVIVLRQGDSFSYPSVIAHRFRNRTDKEATMVWAMSPVRISW